MIQKMLVTTSEMASSLNISVNTLRDLAARGQVPCIRFNGRVHRFDPDAVRAALGIGAGTNPGPVDGSERGGAR